MIMLKKQENRSKHLHFHTKFKVLQDQFCFDDIFYSYDFIRFGQNGLYFIHIT
jgi:hypothetical protein